MTMFDMLVNLNNDAILQEHIRTTVPHQQGYQIVRTPSIFSDEVAHFAEREFSPMWASEARHSLYHTPSDSYAAIFNNHVIGFCAFNATAKAFFGPTGVHHDHRGKGIGRILLVNALLTMKSQGYAYAIIGGVNEAAGFYEQTVSATRIEGSEDHSVYTHMGITF
ncbi:MAG: GNAT family N-acetyltransferase [Bifidobacterium sp.]|nr:GNAT family N-acetyltransferase [Bifidobacterium sp.]MCH4174698.1 GNAT family N-acetyltransferase [Bifidobacterium sp.]